MHNRVSHQDCTIKKLQEKVSFLKKELKESQSQHVATKNTLNKVKKELSMVQSMQFTWEDYHRVTSVAADGKYKSSSSDNSPKEKIMSKSVSKEPSLPESENFSTDISCQEEMVCSYEASPDPQADSATPVQMLTPVRQAQVGRLWTSMISQGVSHSQSCIPSVCRISGREHASSLRGSNGGFIKEINGEALVEAIPPARVAKPLRPLKPGIKVLPSSEIDKFSLMFTVREVLVMFEGSNIAKVARKLAELAVFGPRVLKRCSPCGQSSKRKFALPREELMFIKQTILDHTPDVWDDLDHYEQVWHKKCMAYLSKACVQAQNKHR